jgi:GMP synthase (glutamine-hydrolysing)
LLLHELLALEKVWMSHGDKILQPPQGFTVTAKSDTALAGMENPDRGIYAIQFHPEVTHTENGQEVYRRFIFDICKCAGSWTIGSFIDRAIERIRGQVGDGRAIVAISSASTPRSPRWFTAPLATA